MTMKEREEIGAAIAGFKKAYDSGDLEGVLAYYTEDLIKLRDGAPAETKPDLAARLAEVFKKFHSTVDPIVDEVMVSGDLAVVRGTFHVTLTSKHGEEKHALNRRYLEVWQRQDGWWKVARTMDNEG